MASSGIDALVETMVSSSAPYGQKAKAMSDLRNLINAPGNEALRPRVATALGNHGLSIDLYGNIVVTQTGQLFIPSGGASQGDWRAASDALNQRVGTSNAGLPLGEGGRAGTPNHQIRTSFKQRESVVDPDTGMLVDKQTGLDPRGLYGGKLPGIYDDGSGDGSGYPPDTFGFESGQPASAESVSTNHPQYSKTFFGNVQANAIDELAANPDAAWSLFKTRGGPNQGSLQNSTTSLYGENNFQSAMALAPYLSGGGFLGPEDTLGFTNSVMQRDMSGGGGYMDPAKILNAAFANISADSNFQNQEQGIQDVLKAVAPYIDPTQYEMMRRRVQDVMDQYMAYGLENGQENLTGVLLQMVYDAIGMRPTAPPGNPARSRGGTPPGTPPRIG